jgi:hypothetical protein
MMERSAVNRTGAKINKNLRFEIPGMILRPVLGFLGIFHLNRDAGGDMGKSPLPQPQSVL